MRSIKFSDVIIFSNRKKLKLNIYYNTVLNEYNVKTEKKLFIKAKFLF